VKALEESLLQQFPKDEIRPLLEPFLALADDRDFWNHTLDGLAVLGARGMFRVYKLQRPVAELAVVADSFHNKPLMRILQSADRYHVLGLNRKEIKFFEGNRDALDEIEPAQGVPRTITEALGEELTEPHQTVASYGGVGGGHSPMHHGHGGRESEVDIGAALSAIGPAADPSGAAGASSYVSRCKPQSVSDTGEHRYPPRCPIVDRRTPPAHLAAYGASLSGAPGRIGRGVPRSEGLGDDELAQVAKAVMAGRVATLLIEARREVPGRINAATGDIELDNLTHPEVDDVLDDLGTLALKMGGQVVIVPTERMPTKTGIAAIYRY
jgi:hypothetical protein